MEGDAAMNIDNRVYSNNIRDLSSQPLSEFKENSRIPKVDLTEAEATIRQKEKWMPDGTLQAQLIVERTDRNIYDSYFSFIDEIEDLSAKEKSLIRGALLDSISAPSMETTDGKALLIAQTTFELNYLKEQWIPAEYQEQMNTAIQQLESDRFQAFDAELKATYQQLYEIMSNLPERFSESAESYAKALQEVEQGTHQLQTASRQYLAAFKSIDGKGQLIQGFEQVLQLFEETQLGSTSDDVLRRIVEDQKERAREHWNSFSGWLPQRAGRLPTQYAPAYDLKG